MKPIVYSLLSFFNHIFLYNISINRSFKGLLIYEYAIKIFKEKILNFIIFFRFIFYFLYLLTLCYSLSLVFFVYDKATCGVAYK